jgi:isoaspartyl peptidase/L-asparaginase-like protein (Ntn-hydrolase superfamily)
MIKRRIFIKGSVLGAISTAVPNLTGAFGLNALAVKRPVVVATWDTNLKATRTAMDVLLSGGSALDAVEAGARIAEADPQDDSVGYGGLPDRDGKVTLDACIMDERGQAGSVTFLQHIKHPVSVARKVLEDTPHVMLSGKGALRFALDKGFKKENLLTDAAKKEWEKWIKDNNYSPKNHDTIGILALSENGKMSGGCTTSGRAFKMHGRVGDSPVIGAGMYVDNEVGGACATGDGELVMETLGSFLIVELMRQGMTPDQACKEAIKRILKKYPELKNKGALAGYVALNMNGEIGGYSIDKGFTISASDMNEDFIITPDYYLR